MNKKITIGIFNDSFFPFADGVIMVVDNYARRLSQYANVIVFVPSYPDKPYEDSELPYKVVRCKSLNLSFLDYTLPIPKFDKKFRKKLDKYNLDIVHIHSPFTMGYMGHDYAKKHNIPCIATMHSQFKKDIQKVVKNNLLTTSINNQLIRLFNKCDECWAVNKAVAHIYHEEYGYKTLPKVMENATNMLPLEDPKEGINYINKKHKLKANEKVFLFVGRINTLKNILFIVDALKTVKNKKPKLKFKMFFVGCGLDEDKLRERIEKHKLTNEVIMCGKITNRKELAYYYQRADLFLFPSVYDCSSIVQIEAASQSTPTVFLKDTATSSTVTDNVNGFLSDYSIDAYANKIIEIIENKKLHKEVSQNAFRDLYKNWDDIVKEAFEKYQEIIINRKK